GASIALRRPQRIGVRDAVAAGPRLVVEPGALDDERVAVPAADRIAHPTVGHLRFELAAIHEDDPIREVVVENRDGSGRLHDAPPAAESLRLGPARQALVVRTRLEIFLLILPRALE